MSWLRPIPDRKCAVCGKRATHTLMNARNAECGDFCRRHGEREAKSLTAREEAAWNASRQGW